MSEIDDTLSRVVAELVATGAEAVVLTGSHARGEAGPHSDIDLWVLASDVEGRPEYELRRADQFLLSLSWRRPEQISATFRRPGEAGAAVPDWRGAVLLHDPGGAGEKLIEEAQRWTWEAVEPSCDRWVANEVTGYAEEVHKLVAALEAGQWEHAAVQRDVLALRLPRIMSVQRRLVDRSERGLMELVTSELGPQWGEARAAALSLNGEAKGESTAAALELYRIAAGEAKPLLDATQRAVIGHALALIAGAIDGD